MYYDFFNDGEVELTRERLKQCNVSKIFAVKRNPYSRILFCWEDMCKEFSLNWSLDEFLSHLESSLENWPNNSACPLNWKDPRCDAFDCHSFCYFHKNSLTTQLSVIGNIYPVQLFSFESLQQDFSDFMQQNGFQDFPDLGALQSPPDYDTILTSEQKDRICKIYSDDFQKLGYLR